MKHDHKVLTTKINGLWVPLENKTRIIAFTLRTTAGKCERYIFSWEGRNFWHKVRVAKFKRPCVLGDQKISEDNQELRPGCPPEYQIFL